MTGAPVSGSPSTPLWQANEARREAAVYRAEWLVDLDSSTSTVNDLFKAACTDNGRPLLRLPLRQVLLAEGRIGEAKVGRTLLRIQELLGTEMPVRAMTVAWLLDSRTGGKRFMAWLDANQFQRSKPWPSFPYGSPFSALGGAQAASPRAGGRP